MICCLSLTTGPDVLEAGEVDTFVAIGDCSEMAGARGANGRDICLGLIALKAFNGMHRESQVGNPD